MIKNLSLSVLFLLGWMLLPTECYSQLSMPSFFSDHMVLQREKPITVWGNAQPDSKVTISLGKQKVTAQTSASGQWKATLKALPAGGPYQLTVKSGKETITLTDILLGEVWICSGQSNMEWEMRKVDNADREMAAAHYPSIRSLKVKKTIADTPQIDLEGQWEVCSPETVGDFSAVGYFFARELYNKLNVPIGFINTSWGGTRIEPWMSGEAISQFPQYAQKMTTLQSGNLQEAIRQNDERKRAFQSAITNEPGIRGYWYAETFDRSDWATHAVPALWSNEELRNLDGVVWFSHSFTLPAHLAGQPALLSLGKVDDNDVTWVNGRQVGETIGYDRSRAYNIPEGILKTENTIALKITDNMGGGGIYGDPSEVYIEVDGERFPLNADWKYRIAVSNEEYKYVDLGPNSYPTLLYNAMVAPLVGLGIRGAIWYQGESNADNMQDARDYYQLFPAMINDWRARWNDEFSFYWAQLANFRAPDQQPVESKWAVLRDAQTATLSLPRTGQAVIIDIGDAGDIHPRNKQDVGRRLAYNALNKDYGFTDIIYSGPVCRSVERIENTLVVSYDYIAKGLVSRGEGNDIGGFAIAGTDGVYRWATATIEGDRVVVSHPEIDRPVAIRYAWGDNPDKVNLYNSAGLPAAPFEGRVE